MPVDEGRRSVETKLCSLLALAVVLANAPARADVDCISQGETREREIAPLSEADVRSTFSPEEVDLAARARACVERRPVSEATAPQDESEGFYEWDGKHYYVAACPKTAWNLLRCTYGTVTYTEIVTCHLTKGGVWEEFGWFSGWDLVRRCYYKCRGCLCPGENIVRRTVIAR